MQMLMFVRLGGSRDRNVVLPVPTVPYLVRSASPPPEQYHGQVYRAPTSTLQRCVACHLLCFETRWAVAPEIVVQATFALSHVAPVCGQHGRS